MGQRRDIRKTHMALRKRVQVSLYLYTFCAQKKEKKTKKDHITFVLWLISGFFPAALFPSQQKLL